MEMNQRKPKLSVCVVTYNHEKYIRQCLQSIVDQKTDFDFEVIVGDDASTDKTREIVQEFSEKYADIFKAVMHIKNIGPTENYLSVHNLAQGEYVAHLDGDDFALPGKLEKLANILDNYQECQIVWHRMYILNGKLQSAVGMPIVPMTKFFPSGKIYIKDMAKYYGITGCHSGSMYRASAKKIKIRSVETLDYFFTLSFCADGGYAKYIDEPLGVYRFFSHEKTITRAKGSVITGRGKISLIKEYLISNPELSKQFAAQCVFELLLRIYLGFPLKKEYLHLLFACRAVPSIHDVFLIGRVFLANRNSELRKRFVENLSLNVNL